MKLSARLPPSARDKVAIGRDGIYVTTFPTDDTNAVVLGGEKYKGFPPGAAENMFVGSFREARRNRISSSELRQAIEELEGDSPLKKLL